MNRHALEVLQYPEVLDAVAAQAAGPLGAAAVRALEPSSERSWIELQLRRVEQMVNFLLRGADWLVPRVPDAWPTLRRLGTPGSVLEPESLAQLGVLLHAARETRGALLPVSEQHPLLAELAAELVKLESEEQLLRSAIDPSGEVRDEASRELARIRREIRSARTRIVSRLEQFIQSLPERLRVADASVSLRDGRYVIPVRREGRAEVGGIVHDESATGQTLFIEPPVGIELMNRLRELELAEAREVLRILRELTERMRPHHTALATTLRALVELDSICARARYALRCDGRRPEMGVDGTAGYRVTRGSHPLLLIGAERVVPFDLELDDRERTLLVSGPNTGGKTVLLKAIGLISALAQAGVIPPVGMGTRLPVFRDIFADIGDEQSIEASLSTFSAHLENLREILEHADHESLVLIDEIGSGTDPLEGGALARAVLTELTRRGTLTVATSHLGELKRLASEEGGVVNASLQFDAQELRPTYRLLKGVPGRSYGLAIARRLRMPEHVLRRAESLVPQHEREAERLLGELEDKDRRLSEALREAESARAESVRVREELESRLADWQRRQRQIERAAHEEARRILLDSREHVEAVIEELRSAAAAATAQAAGAPELVAQAARSARRALEETARREGALAASAGIVEDAGTASTLMPGVAVHIEATGAVGTLMEVRDGRGTVEAEGLRLVVPLSGLRAATRAEARSSNRARAARWTVPDIDASPEVDLRGLRADEVAGRLEPALDAGLRAGLGTLRIIHGKGTGALRQVVAELLRSDPRVRSFRAGGPGEGGTGVTVAELA